MQNTETIEEQNKASASVNEEHDSTPRGNAVNAPEAQAPFTGLAQPAIVPQACATCGTTAASGAEAAPAVLLGRPTTAADGPPSGRYIYAIGRFEARFPKPSIEKEFAQAMGRSEGKGLTDKEAFYKVFSDPQNRYLASEVCWVMTINGLDAYIVMMRDPFQLGSLIETQRPRPQHNDLDVAIGMKGPIAPADFCNGLTIPMLHLSHMYSFPRESLVEALVKPKDVHADEFKASTEEVLDRIMQMTDNFGNQDDHRALNYLVLRYPRVYEAVHEAHSKGESWTSVSARPSRLSGSRKILDVIFEFTNRKTDVVSKHFVRVDVTEPYPFLVTKMQPYYDR